MAKVKVILEDDETELDAHVALTKALDLHNSGEIHSTESFEDPAMIDTTNFLTKTHDDIYTDMLQEIQDALDQEYS